MINLFLKYSVSEQNPTILVLEPFSKHALRGEGGGGTILKQGFFLMLLFFGGEQNPFLYKIRIGYKADDK